MKNIKTNTVWKKTALKIYNELAQKDEYINICKIIAEKLEWSDEDSLTKVGLFLDEEVGEKMIYYNESIFLDTKKNDREWQKEKIKKQSESKIKLITLNQQLGFGKYSKLKVKDIISSDPQYIKWVAENTGKRFAEEVYNALKLLNNDIDPSKGENVIDYIPIRVTYASDYSDCFITERSINLLHNGYTNKIKIGNKTKTLFSSIN